MFYARLIYLITSFSSHELIGLIELKVGSSDLKNDGGDVKVEAGGAKDDYQTGGTVQISAGVGTGALAGQGGVVRINGGASESTSRWSYLFSPKNRFNSGGDIELISGSAILGKSGDVLLSSGVSAAQNSGSVGKWMMMIYY